MALHRALADPDVRGDILAGVTGDDEIHHLPLSGRQLEQTIGGGVSFESLPSLRRARFWITF